MLKKGDIVEYVGGDRRGVSTRQIGSVGIVNRLNDSGDAYIDWIVSRTVDASPVGVWFSGNLRVMGKLDGSEE